MPAPLSIPVTISPSSPSHTHTIIFLHGRGDTAQSLSTSLYQTPTSTHPNPFLALPTIKWVFPQAPNHPSARAPYDAFPQWFDVWNTSDYTDNELIQAEGLRLNVPLIRDLIAQEAKIFSGNFERILLAGISMGAAISVHTLFNMGARIGGFVGFSCRCPFAGRSLKEMRELLDQGKNESVGVKAMPVLLECNKDDGAVLVGNTMRMGEILRDLGADVEGKKYQVGGHWFNSPEGMDDFVRFVDQKILGKAIGKQKVVEVRDLDAMDTSEG